MQLQQLKKEFDERRSLEDTHKDLYEKRESLHQEIEQKKLSLEGSLLHERPGEDFDSLVEELRILDHQLDQIDSCSIEELKETLIQEICNHQPNSIEELKTCRKHLLEAQTREKQTAHLLTLLTPLHHALKKGEEAKRRKGFMSYLFRKNPKIQLAEAIHQAELEARKIHPEITDSKILGFLDRLLHEATDPWNRSLYHNGFFELDQQLRSLLASIENRRLHEEQELVQAEENLLTWIEKWTYARIPEPGCGGG